MHEERQIRVLIAEDDTSVRYTISHMLTMAGYWDAGQAADGEEAVRLTQELRPDVVLMDARMPGMDGLEAARIIQQVCPTPVVMLTAMEAPEILEAARDSGVGAFLSKPPEKQQIHQAITIAMARHGDLMRLRRVCGELEERNRQLSKALEEIKTLRGILPVCAYCKKVRDDEGYWEQVDVYLAHHAGAEISHGICPDCMRKHYPDIVQQG